MSVDLIIIEILSKTTNNQVINSLSPTTECSNKRTKSFDESLNPLFFHFFR
jgi:hypothetical protein